MAPWTRLQVAIPAMDVPSPVTGPLPGAVAMGN